MRRFFILLLILMFSNIALAEVVSEVDVHVTVSSKFELSVDRNNIDFDTMEPGELKEGVPEAGIKVSAKSNSASPWYLQVQAMKELSNGESYIPNDNFFWYGWKDSQATGTFYGDKKQVFTLTPALVYEPSPEEYNNLHLVNSNLEGTDVFIKFGLQVPVNQNSGDYHTIVRFTLTE